MCLDAQAEGIRGKGGRLALRR